jgi:hypothetical protein
MTAKITTIDGDFGLRIWGEQKNGSDDILEIYMIKTWVIATEGDRPMMKENQNCE